MKTLIPCLVAPAVAMLLSACGTTAPAVSHSTPGQTPAPEQPQTAQTDTPPHERVSHELNGVTTNVRRMTFAEEGADFDPCVSMDGTRLVFASTQHRPTSDIYIKRTDSRIITRLTTDPADDAMPALSPDGSRIAFASNRAGNWDLYVMSASGGQAVQLTSDSADEIQPSWSPDGTRLVYSRRGDTSGRWELWVTPVQNPAAATFIGNGMHPRWCPKPGTGENGADKILFQLGRDRGRRSFGIWTLDYADGNALNNTEIAGHPDAALINPAWSPDGQWVAFAEVDASVADPDTRPRRASVWMIGIDGDARVRLTSDASASFGPVWTASNRLYYTSNAGGVENIWSLDASRAVAAAKGTTDPLASSPVPHPADPAVAGASDSPHH